ncbi:hypothetical protein MICAE_440005 [Microcystis aeruginosa PCC 9806]|uniref:DUF4760 domain-containing protein n=3 Tax=Microcystaceae TaxID=1890449 RepID=A0A552LKK1_9CHRO|nr:hypothetical protein [Microcystis aeruginosa]TRV20751.1 MAG: hypothetical protein EWV40_12935 [Microcystis flos-aquae Mf_WU_F_19750830_S460]GBL13415.1 hypothetical protein MTo_00705 [Microcystis aeruginosa NIES-1211]CCI14916.1 hypothetical protein MICAE_440005 [Microcystis aeruginosa PCC 9806]
MFFQTGIDFVLSFMSISILFFSLPFVMFTNFNYETLGEYGIHSLDFLANCFKNPQNTLIAGINTGLAIVLGNWVINIFKYRNLIQDISKVFDLVVSNQIDDLYNIRIACESIRGRLTTHAGTIIGSQNDPNIIVSDPQRTIEERKGLLKDIAKIKDRESTIRDDDLYKGKLDDVKFFKSGNLKILVRYFRKLKVILEDLRNFTSYDFPNSIDDFDSFNWRSSEIYKDRTNFLIARINIAVCLGLMTKHIFKSFDTKAKQYLSEVYQLLLNLKQEIQDDKNIYSLLKEDFDTIQEFAQKHKIRIDNPEV